VEIHVNVGAYSDAPHERLRAAVRHTLEDGGRSGEMSVTLVGDDEIEALNAEYLDREGVTDVIAFSLGAPDEVLGDVYICADQARRQSLEQGVPLEEELVRLSVHGVLHVLGHDHPDGAERMSSPMFDIQERLVREVFSDAR